MKQQRIILPPDYIPYRKIRGEIEFRFFNKRGQEVRPPQIEPNIVKIYAKEILSHRVAHSKVWDSTAGTGSGAWVQSTVDPNEEFSAKYILFGASFDDNGAALDTEDERFYTRDSVTGLFVPNRLGPGAEFGGGLINAIPLAEPDRPLKKIENIDFEATYQPAGTPLLQNDVRPMNNILLLETILQAEEYNGFGASDSDFFTITEVALAAGKELDLIEQCECDPTTLFLDGKSSGSDAGTSLLVNLSGGPTVSIDPSETEVDLIKEGDSIKLIEAGGDAESTEILDQITPFYLVLSKVTGGRDVVLDRTPVDSSNTPLTGQAGLLRNTLRIFSHRILRTPVKKSSDFEILVRWRLIFN